MRHLITTFIAVMVFCVAFTQEEKRYSFIHYTTDMGAVSYQVNTVVQDDQGYIWIGTTDGLQRYDGIRFETFNFSEANPYNFPSNPVWQLLLDKQKNLWILFADGKVGIFNRSTFRFTEVKTSFKKHISPNTFAKRLITDEWGNIFYFVAESEILTWNKKANEFSADYNFFRQNNEWKIMDLIQQPGTQKYWMTIQNGGLAVYNRQTGNLSYTGNNTEHEKLIEAFKPTVTYYGLLFDTQKRLWSINWNDGSLVDCYDLSKNQFLVSNLRFRNAIHSYHEATGFYEQKDGTIWIKGMLVLGEFNESEKKFQFIHNGLINEKSIVYEVVHALCEDREKNIWVATDNNGLYSFSPGKELFKNIIHYNKISGKPGKGSPMSFMKLKNGDLLAGIWEDGLYRYDKNFNPIPVNIKGIDNKGGPFIWNMCKSADSNIIWLASQPGFYAFNQQTNTSTYYNPPVLQNRTVRQIAEDKWGNLWLGTQNNGLYKYDRQRNKINPDSNVYRINDIPYNNINKITIDNKGYVWVATPEDGAYVMDPDNNKVLLHFGIGETNELKLPEKGVSFVLPYNDTTIFITTATRLLKYNPEKKQSVVIGGRGIISGFITAVEKDKDGYLWISTTNALFRVGVKNGVFMKFDRNDGLENEHFIQSSSYTLPDGRILFGTTNNMVLFDPLAIKSLIKGVAPNVQITHLLLENKSVNLDSLKNKTLTLPYKLNSLVIEFSPLIYSNAYLIKFKMEGLDTKWITADKNATAIYNYLPPGKYDFVVKTIDENGTASPEKYLLHVEVNHPFWKTWWFFILLTLTFGAILFWLDKERMNRKEATLRIRTDIADDLHKDINTALSNINILSEMAKIKAETDSKKSKEFIEQIHSQSHNMMIAMDDMLWNIDPMNDSMPPLILRLQEFIDSMRNRHGVHIDLLVDKTAAKLPLPMKLRKEIYWLFRNGINTVIKTGGTNCRVYVTFEKPMLVYLLEFDTIHTDMQQLTNLRQRQELADKLQSINAKLELQVHQQNAIFILKIPFA